MSEAAEPINDGGPAFPLAESSDGQHSAQLGITLRDCAAIQFAAAMMANPDHSKWLHEYDERAKIALASADAYIKARSA